MTSAGLFILGGRVGVEVVIIEILVIGRVRRGGEGLPALVGLLCKTLIRISGLPGIGPVPVEEGLLVSGERSRLVLHFSRDRSRRLRCLGIGF